MKEDPRNQKTKIAMYKIIDGKAVIIAKDNRGIPLVIKENI